MMRIVMLVDVVEPVAGVRSTASYFAGQTFEVSDDLGERLCREKKARLFDDPGADPLAEEEMQRRRNRRRREKIAQDFVLEACNKARALEEETGAVKLARDVTKTELAEAQALRDEAGYSLDTLTPDEQEAVRWLEQL